MVHQIKTFALQFWMHNCIEHLCHNSKLSDHEYVSSAYCSICLIQSTKKSLLICLIASNRKPLAPVVSRTHSPHFLSSLCTWTSCLNRIHQKIIITSLIIYIFFQWFIFDLPYCSCFWFEAVVINRIKMLPSPFHLGILISTTRKRSSSMH